MGSDTATRAAELTHARVPFVLATVVRAAHPTSTRAGDTALIHADGTLAGFVGGTCTESSVRAHALETLSTGEPLLLRVRPGVAATTREEGAVTVVNPCLSGGTLEIFLEPRLPTPRVVVVGDTPVGRALASLARSLGFRPELVAGEDAAPAADDAGLVVASHGRSEEVALEAALRAGVPYVGLVASSTRGAAVVASLDVDEEARARVRSPAGLAIGARTAEEIALAILAELVSERAVAPAPTAAEPVPTAAGGTTRNTALDEARNPVRDTAGTTALETAGRPARDKVGGRARDVAPTTAVDPVCGMLVPTAGNAHSAQHGGASVYFCCEHCRAAFVDDPARYAAAS